MRLTRCLAIAALAAALLPTPGLAQTAPGCQFVLGFKTLHDLDPVDIGDCVDNQASAENGDAQQHTTNGLMAWRKADNWTAFTNGYMTWINGPNGLVHRLNTDRFPWEHDAGSSSAAAGPAVVSGSSGVTSWGNPPISPSAIPTGDGKLSTTPEVGFLDSCQTSFSGNGGAFQTGAWFNSASGTWDATKKAAVQGNVTWAAASHSFTVEGSNRVLETNDLPEAFPTGVFPISPSDPAYQYDRNPNQITTQSLSWAVPAMPEAAASPACVGLGAIGILTDGVELFNALDDGGRDAGAHEIQDSCAGHPQAAGQYHHHTIPSCLAASAGAPGTSTLLGYAFDGYGIFLERDAGGNLPSDADLDACHGRTSSVVWDGQAVTMYHYDVTLEYPYTIGCFHGMPVSGGRRGPGGSSGEQPDGPNSRPGGPNGGPGASGSPPPRLG